MHTSNNHILPENLTTTQAASTSFLTNDHMAYVKITIMIISLVVSIMSCYYTLGETKKTILRHFKHRKRNRNRNNTDSSPPPISSSIKSDIFISPSLSQ